MAQRRRSLWVLVLMLLGAPMGTIHDAGASGPVAMVAVVPSPRGTLGAWRLTGPYRSRANDGSASRAARAKATNVGTPEPAVAPTELEAGAAPRPEDTAPLPWSTAASGDGPVDVRATLAGVDRTKDVVAFAHGVLRVAKGGRYHLFAGSDDGLRITVDGAEVLRREDGRSFRADEDHVALDLTAGDHPMVLRLHHREGAWTFQLRVVDDSFGVAPGMSLLLPGAGEGDAQTLAARMAWVSVDRGAFGGGYAPRVTLRYPEGSPARVSLPVRVRLRKGKAGGGSRADLSRSDVLREVAGEGVRRAGDLPDGVAVERVVMVPPLLGPEAMAVEGSEVTVEVEVAGRVVTVPFAPRRNAREALARADEALAATLADTAPAGARETVAHLRNRLARLASRGDTDAEAQSLEVRELDDAARALAAGRDPFAGRTGLQRRAYVSPVDGELHEFGVYVPPSFHGSRGRKYPLIVALHGLNGSPLSMIRYLFGGDDPKRDSAWEDRHGFKDLPPDLPPLEAFVVAPSGHGNGMYRQLGEDDVLRVLDWAQQAFPIDENRVTITGPSMGGIGAAALPFHHPDRFAAAMPLCGYHSTFVRRDVQGKNLKPWERFLAEERSNVFWAENGQRLPLFIAHGTQDLPEANSGVLIARYEELHYDVTHEHPEVGHNVWQPTYENLRGAKWLTSKVRDPHPRSLRFRTARPRFADDAWLHIDELASPTTWAEVEAKVVSPSALAATTRGALALHFDRDPKLLGGANPITVTLDGETLRIPAGAPLAFRRAAGGGGRWSVARDEGPSQVRKRGNVAGPFRDAFHEPLLFVYGVDDPRQATMNEEVARAWAAVRPGVSVKYPILSDAEFLARGESLAHERSLFLVGNAQSNRVLRALEGDLPVRIDGESVVVGSARFKGAEAGAAFLVPNPRRADRYLVVVEGVDALGTWRSLSLPDLLPDFIVYDQGLAPARGQMILGAGTVRAAGFFQNDWSLPPGFGPPAGDRPSVPAEMIAPAAPIAPISPAASGALPAGAALPP